jgi:Uma2 family endonuclease
LSLVSTARPAKAHDDYPSRGIPTGSSRQRRVTARKECQVREVGTGKTKRFVALEPEKLSATELFAAFLACRVPNDLENDNLVALGCSLLLRHSTVDAFGLRCIKMITRWPSREALFGDGYLRPRPPRIQTMVMVLPVPRFTIEMLDEFPDDGTRYELLEGSLLVTPAPSMEHQVVATRLVNLLFDAVGNDAHVVAVGAIQRGDNTQLQPDILVLPASYPPTANWREVHGWWLAVEVLSPSSRVYDREVKRAAYLALGVEEYWLVDPRTRSIEIWKPDSATGTTVSDTLEWRPRTISRTVVLDLEKVFLR